MNRGVKIVLVAMAALAVATVLITPAFDELPTTIPHIFHLSVALPIVGGPHLYLTSSGPLPDSAAARILNNADFLSLTCIRLC